MEQRDLAALMGGLLVGCLLRDFRWLRLFKELHPLNVRITDWEKVREMAGEAADGGRADGS